MMAVCSLPLDPPLDNLEMIETIMRQAFELFLKKGYNSEYQDIYDLIHEEIEENIHKYLPQEEEYDVCCY